MNPLLFYVIQVIVASGLFYGYYHFALRNKKFHQYNRFYLLAATIISLVLPFINIPVYFSPEQRESSFVLQTLTNISYNPEEASIATGLQAGSPASSFKPIDLMYLLYILFAVILHIKIVASLFKIRRIAGRNKIERLGNINFVNTNEPGTPFSFFRWLFWNRKIELRSEKGEQVLRHELYHIRQRHSVDVVTLELVTALGWFNPFFHLIKKELKTIHEFLADQHAVADREEWSYAELLLMQAFQTRQSLVNPFFHNQIKRRIAMITSSKKTSYRYLRKIMVLPVTFIIVALCAFSYKQKNTASGLMPAVFSDTVPKHQEKPIIKKEPIREDVVVNVKDKVFVKTEKPPTFPGGDKAWAQYLEKNVNPEIPLNNGAPEGIYKVTVRFIVGMDGKISYAQALTKNGYGIEYEAVRVVANSPDWNPAIQNGHKVNAYKTQTITFVIAEDAKEKGKKEIKKDEGR